MRGPQKQPASSARSLGCGMASMSFKISFGWVFGLCTVWVSGISKSSAGSSVANFILRAVLKMVLIIGERVADDRVGEFLRQIVQVHLKLEFEISPSGRFLKYSAQ